MGEVFTKAKESMDCAIAELRATISKGFADTQGSCIEECKKLIERAVQGAAEAHKGAVHEVSRISAALGSLRERLGRTEEDFATKCQESSLLVEKAESRISNDVL